MKAAILMSKIDENLDEFTAKTETALTKLNVKVDKSYFELSVDDMQRDLGASYSNIKAILQKADIVVVENTLFSTGMGLLIGRVIELNKPMLVLYNRDSQTELGHSILVEAHAKQKGHGKVFYEEYAMESLESQVTDFAIRAKKLLNTKFLFNLSPDMARYLQWSSEENNRTMVDILRELLENKMSEDEKWLEYMKENDN